MFQNEDGRIVFVIPYENEFTLIGTTDRDYQGDPARVEISKDEIDYLCQSVSGYFAQPVTPADVVWTYAGVRPLYDDGASEAKAATRDYVFELDASDNLPLLSIFGGKITTYRRLSEEALERLAPYLPESLREREGWTAASPLPGGDFDVLGLADLANEPAPRAGPSSRRDHALRLARSYGTRARDILKGATSFADLGRHFGATPDGGRGALCHCDRMGADRRRHALAALQARPAADAATGRRARSVDARAARNVASRATRTRENARERRARPCDADGQRRALPARHFA